MRDAAAAGGVERVLRCEHGVGMPTEHAQHIGVGQLGSKKGVDASGLLGDPDRGREGRHSGLDIAKSDLHRSQHRHRLGEPLVHLALTNLGDCFFEDRTCRDGICEQRVGADVHQHDPALSMTVWGAGPVLGSAPPAVRRCG